MPLYEHVFLARQDMSGQQVEALVDHYKSVIADNGGEIGKVEYWGLKSIAFRLKKNRKAHYTLMNITAPPAAVAEMERQMRINEDILRHLTLRVDELEAGPSVMMQKRDRDERRGDRPGGRDFGRDRDRDGGRDRPRRDDRADGDAGEEN
jgi:small subunit ribosomal protein S6